MPMWQWKSKNGGKDGKGGNGNPVPPLPPFASLPPLYFITIIFFV